MRLVSLEVQLFWRQLLELLVLLLVSGRVNYFSLTEIRKVPYRSRGKVIRAITILEHRINQF